MEFEKLMAIKEVAKLLNVKISWLRSAIFRREIPYIKVGNHVRFQEKDLLDWPEKNKVHGLEERN